MAVAKKAIAEPITVASPREALLTLTVRGVTPLLVSRMSEAAQAAILNPTGARKVKGARKDPEEQWREALHVIDADAGRYGIPSSAFHQALIKAGGRYTAVPMTEWRGRFHLEPQLLEIRGPAPRMHFAWCRQKDVPMPAFRAEFVEWEVDVPMSYDVELIDANTLASLLARAGYSIGVGSWRPEKSGSYGRFKVLGDY